MTPAVLQALRAFAAEYLGATGTPNSRGYSARAVVERADACVRHRDALPRTIEFAPLRAWINTILRSEDMAFYETDVVMANYERREGARRAQG